MEWSKKWSIYFDIIDTDVDAEKFREKCLFFSRAL